MSDTRRLAAIMFTDIVGYTALMGADEHKALRVLARSRALVQRLLPRFHGELIEELGDGALCSFQSALEAVHCAGAIQTALRSDPDLHVRIGIHLGDVIFSAEEVIGDGVNVASRIHALAKPGGICVSEPVYDVVRNQPDIRATSLGECHLKNVNRPIKVYALSTAQTAASSELVPHDDRRAAEGSDQQALDVAQRQRAISLEHTPNGHDARLTIGSAFQGGYEILAELGAGSFGRVYKARQLSTGQAVAIKMLRLREGDSFAEIANQVERFRREMRLCAELSHPNLVRLIDSGESDEGQLYAVFEFVPGSTMKEVLAAEGKLSLPEAVRLMTQVLDALSCAHARGVVHRDLKPENIMVTKTGVRRNAMVLDLGLGGFTREARNRDLARLTATQEMMGTPCYAAPEQLRGEPPSTRSDLYSWGLIFLECLTGKRAVGGASAQEVILKQIGPEPVVIPAWLRSDRLGRLLQTVTAKQTEKRDVTIEGLLEVLEQIAPLARLVVPSPTGPQQLAEGERRQLSLVCCRLTVTSLDGTAVDVEDLDQLLHTERARWAELAGRSGGHIATVMADRVLLVFGYPNAREDDARRAARTALQIAAEVARASARLQSERGMQLDVCIGVHTGLVIVRELRQTSRGSLDDVVGPTPQVAARLMELAGPGEVLVSADTHRLLRGEVRAEAAGTLAVSGVFGNVPVFRLIRGEQPAAGLETMSPARETPLVGRARQLAELLETWARTKEGKAAAVVIRGESGIGKSRLVRELRRQVPADAWLECRCVAENHHSPLRPVVDLLMTLQPIEALLTRYGFELSEHYPLFAALLSTPLEDRYAPLQLSPERQKELTLNTLQALLSRMAEERPLVFVVEDLHWADPTTLELATQLVQEVRTAEVAEVEPTPRVYLVFTARPEFTLPWSMDDVSLMQLPRLSRQDVEEMIKAGLAHDRPFPGALLDQVVRRADGVPLFVEEVTRMLIESGMLSEQAPMMTVAPNVEIPSSLRDLLTARLDGLSPSARETVQLAAVLGREFRYELLSVVSRRDELALREDLNELATDGLIYQRRSVRSESYVFKHALVREAAYESMVRSRRQRVHLRIANTLRQRFPDLEQNRPEILALHFEKGSQIISAAALWHRAGDRALKHAAYVEAIHQLERGLRLVQSVAASPERTRLEMELLTTLGTALLMTKGYAADEVERIFAHAWDLCEQLGEDIPLKVLYGIWGVQIARGDGAAVDKLVPGFQRLAARGDDPVAALTAHSALGVNAFWRGNFVEAEEHLARGRQLYGVEACGRFAVDLGYDAGLYSHAYGMFALWQLGYPDQAEALRRELLAIGERSGNPYSIALALGFGSSLAYDRGDTEGALEMSDRLSALATEQHFYLWSADAACSRGGALLQRGDTQEAISLIQQGLSLYQAIGALPSYGFYLSYLAAAYLRSGRATDGLAVVNEGLSLCQTLLARFYESELLRLKGNLLALQGDCGAADAWLRRALEVAQRQRALSYELRVAMSLGRLLSAQGKKSEGRSLLRDVYDRFTEGFDTRDLRDATAFLAELA